MEAFIYVSLALCGVSMIALAVYIILAIRRRSYIAALYSSNVRDSRFAYSLLKIFFGKYVLRSLYLLKDQTEISPRADVIAVLRGGLVIITVLDKKGTYVTPPNESWTLTTEEGMQRIPNAHKSATHYLDAINEALLKAGISSQIMANVVLLSDDNAKFDELYPEGVLTGRTLVEYCKEMNKTHIMSTKERRQIVEALTKHSKLCRAYIDKGMRATASQQGTKASVSGEETDGLL